MDPRLAVALLVVGLAAAAYPTLAAPPAPPTTRAFTLEVVAYPCALVSDGVCLAYRDPSLPSASMAGPTLDVNLGDTLVITLVNRIAETLPSGAPAHLATAAVSWHVHGTAVSPDMDGVAAHPGTNLVASVAEAGGSFTYRTRAAFAGPWHYHDHVLGLDGDEGVERGLFGGLVVRTGGAIRPDEVIDIHALNARVIANDDTVTDGPDADDAVTFELLIVGLEDITRTVEVFDPTGARIAAAIAAPGLSESVLVEDAVPGTYTWKASGPGPRTGSVAVS